MIRYAHTNLIARNARALIGFYQAVLGCESIGQTRDLSGEWLERLTNVPGAHIVGEHLALPGNDGNITLPKLQNCHPVKRLTKQAQQFAKCCSLDTVTAILANRRYRGYSE